MAQNNFQIAENIITNNFSFLEKLGYTFQIRVLDSEVFMESLEVKYINKDFKREIHVSYTKGCVAKDTEIIYTFSLSIIRHPYDGIKDFLSLSVYSSSMGKYFDTNIANIFDESKARGIVEEMAELLKTDLRDVVIGRKWLEGYYPKW